MKRIIALLLSLFISIGNDVNFIASEDKEYNADAYYTLEVMEPPDYRDIYGSNPVAARNLSCRAKTYKSNGKTIIYSSGNDHINAMWVEDGVSKNYDELPTEDTFQFTSDGFIIIPYDGQLLTSSENSNGHTMLVKCSVGGSYYRLDIQNMERWWCCVGRDLPTDVDASGKVIWNHTCRELRGESLPQGTVLGKAQEGTTITVSIYDATGDSVSNCSIKDLYTH